MLENVEEPSSSVLSGRLVLLQEKADCKLHLHNGSHSDTIWDRQVRLRSRGNLLSWWIVWISWDFIKDVLTHSQNPLVLFPILWDCTESVSSLF